MFQLQKGAQAIANLNEVPGGSTAFHKCATQLLSWKPGKDFLEIDYDIHEYRIVLEDAVGAPSTISQLGPDDANKGLGYHFAFKARLEKVATTCSGATSTRLSCGEGLKLLNLRLLLQTKYGLHLSQFKPDKSEIVGSNQWYFPSYLENYLEDAPDSGLGA
jgi:hypothetical protein